MALAGAVGATEIQRVESAREVPSTPTLQAEWEEFLAVYQSWETGRRKTSGCEKAKEGWFSLPPSPCPPTLSHKWHCYLAPVSWDLHLNLILTQKALDLW